MTPELKARVSIDAQLQQAAWHVCNVADANIHASVGVAIREFPLNTGFGFADYRRIASVKASRCLCQLPACAVTATDTDDGNELLVC